MARYINEDEFIAWVKEKYCSDCNNDNGLRCRVCWLDDAIDLVEEAPPADVAPKSEVAREIFEEIEKVVNYALCVDITDWSAYTELKNKYTEEKE